jgi:predicted nucleotidyltransferase component of viral defense system
MINPGEIDEMADTLGINSSHVQRDYVHGWLLSVLYSSSTLADRLILKGGNCLRKGYFENSRYSRDLDFTTSTRISDQELGSELDRICGVLAERAGIVFDTGRTRVAGKTNADSEREISEARLYFRDFYGNDSELILAVRLDVTQFDRLYLPPQVRNLIHPYSDADTCRTTIKCVKLEELLASKMRCLLQRRHIADLFDLVYAVFISGDIEVNRRELLSTFFRVTIFQPSPGVVKGLFLDLPLEALRRAWGNYINCPRPSWFDFDRAKECLISLIESLISGPAIRDRSPIFFPSSLRNPIMDAADSLTMLKLRYDGAERLVEPYELTFKIRKDGVAREYFYVYDTTGGRSSGPGIKTFVPGKVEAIENTDVKFEPRFNVELKKAGGAETVEHFEGKGRSTSDIRPSLSRPVALSSGRMEYVIQCSYCNRRFKRKTRNGRLNPHMDGHGNKCHGRIGFIL